ncbi:uncharacterized protein TM35_000292110 [Trypanosoma theileri]|uniref:Uncharacterized protein n=1 Tax=Trypanosoma theileri TaxID=67003 RepID=A0A1X0NQ64_9TRYP|nr:uncharacterized protein TM35_000292110 [Trypanosoma theileri]ORC86329.1 hypothetical protein TM35_000292110 [Trypanosoma theileri]
MLSNFGQKQQTNRKQTEKQTTYEVPNDSLTQPNHENNNARETKHKIKFPTPPEVSPGRNYEATDSKPPYPLPRPFRVEGERGGWDGKEKNKNPKSFPFVETEAL